MESLSHMYVLPYHILGNLLRKEKQDSHLAAPPNAKAGGGALMQVKSYATLPPGKAASMRRPVMMSPAASSPSWTGSTLPLSSSHRAEREEGRRHCHRSLLYEKPGSHPCPGRRTRRLYPSVHRWRRSDRSPKPRAF